LNDLLAQPLAVVHRARQGMGFAPLRLLGGALVCVGLYGAAAGFFQGGDQIAVSAFKAPLIVALSLLLCLPSLYVFTALAGARWSPRVFLAVVAGFAGTLGLLLAGLLPIAWLFSLSSRHLAAVTWIHVFLWILAVLVGWRFLGRALAANGVQGGMFLWLLLFCIVSFQVATYLRPVLWHDTGTPLFRSEKMSFFENLGKVFDDDETRDAARRKAEEERAAKAEKEKAEKAKQEAEKKKAATPAPPRS
jgi:signal transduction histidine kinase